ncbi:MAG: hypothetical protein KAU20_06855 [Nanoarchaeota archaeon]|nr:hypothetical protein [Nanoarchaeota archaeon]
MKKALKIVVVFLVVMLLGSCEGKPNKYDVCLAKYEAGISRMEQMRIYDNDFIVEIEYELNTLKGMMKPLNTEQLAKIRGLQDREIVILEAGFVIVGNRKSMYDIFTVELN